MLADGSGWETVHDVVQWAVRRQRDTADALRFAENRHEDLSRDGMDDAAVHRAEDRVSEARTKHEQVRRDKKSVFANLFASACAALAESATAGGIAPSDPEWRRLCVGHVHELGRRHRLELTLEAIEDVAEGSDVPQQVREEVFEPLRRLDSCCA